MLVGVTMPIHKPFYISEIRKSSATGDPSFRMEEGRMRQEVNMEIGILRGKQVDLVSSVFIEENLQNGEDYKEIIPPTTKNKQTTLRT